LLLVLLVGCLYPVSREIDASVCDLAARPVDLAPVSSPSPSEEGAATKDGMVKPTAHQEPAATDASAALTFAAPQGQPPEKGISKPLDEKGMQRLLERFKVPPGLPGANAPEIIRLPPLEKGKEEERNAILARTFPPLPPLGPDPQPAPGPEGKPLTLADLQRLARANSPLIKQAAANVKAAEGAARQAGLPPNPTVGYEADTVGTTGRSGYQGGFVEQIIKTANKLQLARAAATMDLFISQLAYRRAQTDLATQVRGGYFGVLVAAENVRVSRALAQFTAAIYDYQAEQLRTGGFVSAYEPLLLRVLAEQARLALIQARNNYVAAWKQLASNLGLPALPLTELAGRIDMAVPLFNHEAVLAYALRNHTDVRTAENNLQKARFNLRLAQVTPIPDVDVRWLVQKDDTGPPFNMVYSLTVGVPLPVWDRNQGNIIQAQGNLINAAGEPHRVRDALTSQLADAYARYQNGLVQVRTYRDRILPDQVLAFRLLVRRFATGETPGGGTPIASTVPGFLDLFTAQQTLQGLITSYVTALGQMWQGVVDVANVLQTDDLFQIGTEAVPTECLFPIPVLEGLPPLPCCHPCSPLPDPRLKGMDGSWAAEDGSQEAEVIPVPPKKDRPAREKKETRRPLPPSDRPLELPTALPPLVAEEPLPEARPKPVAKSEKVIAVGAPEGVDPQLLEPPPELPGSREGTKKDK
jgi:cobalt-zinc-cadmium efflux system outer membrane protein